MAPYWIAQPDFGLRSLWAHKGSEELPFDPETDYHPHFPKSEPTAEYELRSDLYGLFGRLIRIVLYGVRLNFSHHTLHD